MPGSVRDRSMFMDGRISGSPTAAWPRARRMLRAGIRALQQGQAPEQPTQHFPGPIPTYAGDTVLHIPAQSGRDDGALLKEVSHKVAEIYLSADHLTGTERKADIVDKLKSFEAEWT